MAPDGKTDPEFWQHLLKRIEELSVNMERMRLAEYVDVLQNPKRLLYINFLIGVARGFGGVVGATVLVAIILYFLQKALILNLPVIGDLIAQLVRIVQVQLNAPGGFPGTGR
ncbi:MAG TPA: hypothetical protein GXX39_06560 [Syntrophothermus lipocalidus]|uniref:Uncharacterized protein n=1 Tax=Syntrophothermus lipocalidus (strain DSM 12680 / TGB-C1) TaxID=643648 RepID=D7CLM7_SYNLT|nr:MULTISPECIES: DUF5665 domain-containing protein [Syntrophothermus]ADI01612.1 conserved hypothetical protein [Syntrophothermus lipocalidus DSM 12680]NSW82268.1 hypothetical protein [Syntrophothermus sp.]HHV77009.1 hypothetical protein [Syntrophothermus lipocalidus]HOV43925.1 DUF5665 domain-containing protein [Syntrophothermus lipocalidus]